MKKPKILLIPNIPNWAFDNQAKQLKKRLSKYYNIDIKYHSDFKKITKNNLEEYKCIFVFFWPALNTILKYLTPETAKQKLITGIFSYNSWKGKKNLAKKQFNKCRGIIINNKKIVNLFKSKENKYEIFYMPKSVDSEIFYPQKNKPTKNKTNKLIIGWAGNPDHVDRNYKGYWNILLPVYKKNTDWLELKTAFNKDNFIPHHKMNDFYNSIDVLICVSKAETGPNTVLEAGACKVAIISTKVGIVEEIIKDNYNGLIINRNQKSLEESLKKLYNNKKLKNKLANNLYNKIIKDHTFKKNIKSYHGLFKYIIKQ